MRILFIYLAFMQCFLFSNESIVLHIEKNLQEIGEKALEVFKSELDYAKSQKLKQVFIFPTGSTPLPFYEKMVASFFEGKLDLSQAVFFNMDEYVGLDRQDPNSYYFYMDTHLYHYITPNLSKEKLEHFGLRPLTKKECSNKKRRLRLNEQIEEFCSLLLEESKQNLNTLEVLENVTFKLKSTSRTFKYLEQDYMNDRALPSFQILRSLIEKDITLRSFCPKMSNIHRLHGSASDLESEVKSYRESLLGYLEDPGSWVTCFGGIGVEPAHIAFNDFNSEELFIDSERSEEEKNQLALNSETRLISLSLGTRDTNARFFEGNVSQVPTQAITIGFKEIFLSNRIVILATGASKKKPLYHLFASKPSYQVPASLLQCYDKGELTFLIDEKSYGLGQSQSLFSLNILQKKDALVYNNNSSNHMSFWDVPKSSTPTLLYKGQVKTDSSLKYASIPKNKKVLWVKEGKLHYSLWRRFKDNDNKIEMATKLDLPSLKKQILKVKPDILVLPYTHYFSKNLSELNEFLKAEFEGKPILGIFYDIGASYCNVHLPLSKSDMKNKALALKKFHQTQSKRTNFDLITQEMGRVINPVSPFLESFTFFKLKLHENKIHRVLFPKNTYIKKGYKKNKKLKDQTVFSFREGDLVISVSPHPDDTEIGLGGMVQHLGRENIPLVVFNATSGHRAQIHQDDLVNHPYMPDDLIEKASLLSENWVEDKEIKAEARKLESLEALAFLNPKVKVCQLDLPFYDEQVFSKEDREIIDKAFKAHIQKTKRLIVFLPHPSDQHQTHRQTYQIFRERLLYFLKDHPDQEVILAYYTTPWTGHWNLYDYSYKNGSKLSALTGAEQLIGHGQSPPKQNLLGGSLAHKYRLFYFK